MKRRAMLTAVTAATGAVVAAPATAAAAEPKITWRLGSSWPKNLDTIYGAADVMADKVRAVTDGRFDIRVYGPGELVPAFQVADAVQQGTLECAHTSPTFFFGKDEAFAIDNGLPFGLTSRQMTSWLVQGGGAQLMREFYRGYNLVSFSCGNTGTQMAGWFRRELKSVADLSGLKFRSGGFGGAIWQTLGVVPQNIPGGDVYTALERGTIDGAEFVGPYDDEKLGLHKIARYYYYPSFVEPSAQVTLLVNAKAYDALPASYKQAIELATSYAHVDMQSKYDARNPEALRRLVASGVQLRQLPRDIVETAYKNTMARYEEIAARNPRWKKLMDSYMKFRDDQLLWSRFAEGGYESMVAALRSAERAPR